MFGTRQPDVPASQSRCSLWDSNSVPFASNAITLSTQLLSPDSHLLVQCGEV
ncbi:unnamed protein product [Schistosoma mattheei]|uniref:Uncharacterized protein n=1 Tax=Schistosoma mattheei TaxID=31246 RepID=A0A3P8G5Z9_9TREM|nr:unnamed protein product [Schistosoma mattheei]